MMRTGLPYNTHAGPDWYVQRIERWIQNSNNGETTDNAGSGEMGNAGSSKLHATAIMDPIGDVAVCYSDTGPKSVCANNRWWLNWVHLVRKAH